jgi:hypothetical protein
VTVKKADGQGERGPLNDLTRVNAGFGWRGFAEPVKINTSSGEKFCELRRARLLRKSEHRIEQLHHDDIVRIGRWVVIGNVVVLLRGLED